MADLLEVSGENANGEGLLLSKDLIQNDVYTAGKNIKITPKTTPITEDVEFTTYEISGKDWNTEIESAVSGKQDTLEFGYKDGTSSISSINDSAIYYEPSNSWKQWSEEHNSSGDENSVYVGENISANNSYVFGKNITANNSYVVGDNESVNCNGEPAYKFDYPELEGDYIGSYIWGANGYTPRPIVMPSVSIKDGNITSGVMLQFSIYDYYFSGASFTNNGEIHDFSGLTECYWQAPITFISDIEEAHTVIDEIDRNGSANYHNKIINKVLTYKSENAKTEFLKKCNDLCKSVSAFEYDTHKYVFGSNNTDNTENSNIIIGELNDISADVAGQYYTPIINKINIGNSNKISASVNVIGSNNLVNGSKLVLGDSNIISRSHIVLGNTNTAGNADVLVGYGNNFGDGICVGVSNQYLGDEDGIILGYNNTIGAGALAVGYNNYAGYADVFGSRNSANAGYVFGYANTATNYNNIIVGGENNATEFAYILGYKNTANDSFYKFIVGADNIVSGQSIVLGWTNSARMAAGGHAAQNHIFGVHNDVSGGYVIGFNNQTSSNSNNTFIIGSTNTSNYGGYGFGSDNTISGYGGSLVLGHRNSASYGGYILGSYNSGSYGHRIVGEYNIANYGGWAYGYNNKSENGSFTIGESNSGSYGGGAIGYGNIGGKGGLVIGYYNKPKKYNSETSSYEQVKTLTYSDIPTQYALGSGNEIRFINKQYMGFPLQLGFNNILYEQIVYNDVTYDNNIGGQPFAVFNIGYCNSAVNHGINLGANNLILTGDGSIAASINIGKSLVNRYGVLIGQNISSYGYGIGLGSYIPYVMNGDSIVGFNINANTNGLGESGSYNARNIFGSNINGIYTYDANVFGSYISAYSGVIPNRTTPYKENCYGIGYGSIVIGTHIKGGVQYGSMLIAQNGQDADRDLSNNIIPLVAQYDSTIIGGYSHNNYDQSAYYRNPGISAYCNAFILGQGQQMTASYNSIIVGQQSIAIDGSKVFGSHGYARGASLVMNQATMTYAPKSITISHINGMAVTSAPEIYGSYTAEGILKWVNGSLSAEKIKLSGDRIHPFNKNNIYYWAIFHKTNLTNENSSFAAFNLRGDGWISRENGYWNNDKTIFTKDASYGQNAIILKWTRGAYLLRIENGVKKLYEYNEQTSSTVDFPLYAVYADEGYPTYNNNNFYSNPGTSVYDRFYSPNSLKSHNILTDGKFIYHMPGSEYGGGYKMWNSVTSYIPTSFSGSDGYEGSSTYYYSDGKIYTSPIDVTAYGLNGVTGQISQRTSSVYPSAIYDVSSMVVNSTAEYGSISIGQKNSSYNGSVAINTEPSGSNDGWTAQHSISYNQNTYEDKNYYVFNDDSTTISLTSDTKTIPTYRSAGFVMSADAENIAGCASVSIGVGTKGGWSNSAWEQSLVIGSKSTAAYNSFAIGRCASANEHAFALGHSNGCTAYNFSYSLGGNGCNAEYYSYALGHDGISARNHSYVFGTHGVYAENNGFAFGGQGISARNQGIALGFYGVLAENIDSNGGGYGQGWGIAIGSNGVTSKNGGIAFGYNGVYSENRGCIAIGSSGVNASGEPSIAIGSFGTYAYNWGLSIGAKGRATNQSINFSMGSYEGSYTTAENGSINILAATHNSPAGAFTKSISIRASEGGATTAQNGSINIISNSTGRTYTTANNQSMILATKYYHPQDAYINAYNNSMVLGAGILLTSASNDSISIGGGKFIDNNSYSQQIYNGSVAIGYGNTANGGVFVQGSRNLLGTTYTAFENRPIDYTQSIVFGDSNTAFNYKPYLWANASAYSGDKYISAYISTDSNKTPHGNGSATYTKNMIVGNFNYVVGYNSFTFGLNNTAGCPEYNYNQSTDKISGDKNDDGFTYIFGLNNRAVRNYDMAIGYGSIASGGENIAIGAIKKTESYGNRNTKALGYKNIAIRSNIAGISNIAIDTDIVGNIAESFDPSYYREYNLVHDNNQYYNAQLSLNQVDDYQCNISKNIINNANITANIKSFFDHNIIHDLTDGILSGSLTHNDILHNKNLILKTQYTSDGIEDNMFLHTTDLSAEVDEFSHNIFSHIQGNIIAQQSHNNLLFNSNIDVSANKDGYRGFSNNFTQNSTIRGIVEGIGDSFLFNSYGDYNNRSWGANNADVLFFSRHITEYNSQSLPNNSVVGYTVSEAPGQNFLFGTFGVNLHSVFSFSDRQSLGEYYTTDEPWLINCCRVYNFGDNTINNAGIIHCVGESNKVINIKVSNINGNGNYATNDFEGDTSDFVDIYGNTNNYVGTGINGTIIGYTTIIGNNNDFVATTSADISNNSITRNMIIGTENGFHSIKTSSFSGKENLVSIYSNNNNTIGSVWNGQGYYSRIGNPLTFVNRSIILGQHSVISDAINDSISIGSNNLIYNSLYESKNNFTEHDVISNNFALGSYNLVKDGSNQIAIGVANNTSGYNATAIGEGLIAKTSQMVVGRFNEELDGTNGLSADDIDSTSGALFIVGNGKHIVGEFEPSAVVRSNAMVVSANGTVSAGNFATSSFNDINATLNTITNFGAWDIVNGTTTADITNPNIKTIYLIKNTAVTGTDQYEEWICTNTATPTYEKIGDTSVDLSQYVPLSTYNALVDRVTALETLLTTYSARWVLTQQV